MVSDGDPRPADVLASVVEKESVLAAIEEAGGIDLRGLVEATPYSKSTVNRAVNEFSDLGLVRTDAGGQPHQYYPTFLGCQLLAWARQGRAIYEARALSAGLAADAPLPGWVVAGGSVVTAADAPGGTQHVFDQVLDVVSRSDRFRVLVPTLTQDATFDHVAREALEHGTSVEAVLPAAITPTLRERFGDRLERLFGADHVTAHQIAEAELPYALGVGAVEEAGRVVDGAATLVCYDEQFHSATGSVVNETPAAVAWAADVFEDYQARASELAVEEVAR